MTSGDVLGRRALNRATLQRQNLLQRARDVPGTLEHLVGMQAQNPLDPYFAMWSRVDGFDPDDLAGLVSGRRAVRAALMRGTIHLVTADDYGRIEPVFREVSGRVFQSTQFAKDTASVDRRALLRAAGAHLAGDGIGRGQLGRLLTERWPDVPASSLAYAATSLLSVVQVTPRGVWGQRGEARWATADAWLGEDRDAPSSVDDIVLRYLGAFGPATVSDARVWSGLTGLRDVFDRLRHRLRIWRGETGAELFDLPEMEYPDPDTPAPPRFLPEYDNVLLGHADRSRFFDEWTPPGWVGNLLVDGMYVGSWKLAGTGADGRLAVTFQTRLPRSQRHEVEGEGQLLLRWATGGDGVVELTVPD